MHRLDPTTTVLTAALALMTALALASETPFTGVGGAAGPAAVATEVPPSLAKTGERRVAFNAGAIDPLPHTALARSRK